MLAGLTKRGLIREIQTGPQQFVITREGLIRIGVEPADSPAGTEAADVAAEGGTVAPVRPGTKQALLIDLLKRPEGATVEQIAEHTGWQHHTIRGAISGALKKKLGFTVEATRTLEVGPNKSGAKGSTTVYRIVA